MFFSILLNILPFLIHGNSDRPELSVSGISAELKKDAFSVVRNSITTYDIKSSKSYKLRVIEDVTIFDKRSPYDVLVVPYDQYAKAKIVSASIYDLQGRLIRNIRKDEIADMSAYDGVSLYSDNRFLKVQLIGGGFPYSVSYEYEIQYHATMSYPDWDPQRYYSSVERSEFHISHPNDLEIVAKTLNGVVPDMDSVDPQKIRHRKWSVKNLSAVRYEELTPPWYDVFPSVMLAPYNFVVDNYAGTMRNWAAFGKFIYDLNLDREKLTPAMAAQVQRLIADADDDSTKIHVLYDYLKSTMRYVSVQLGIGGWQAYSAEYVEKNKYGDCKALSYFMKGMLSEAGIEAYPALVPMDMSSYFVDDFVTAGSFNHMMLYIPERDMWLECTGNRNPTGYIYDVTSDRDVLLITPEGGIKARTPAKAIEESSMVTTDTIYLNHEHWHISGQQVFTCGPHDRLRYVEKDLGKSAQELSFKEDFALSVSELEHLQYSVEADMPVATCVFKVSLAQYGSVSGNRVFLPINPLYRFESACVTENRLHDIYRQYPVVENNSTTIIIPEGYEIESLPAAKTAEDVRFGSYTLRVSQKDNALIIERSLRIPRMQLDAEVYSEMCAFNKLIETTDRGSLVLKKVGQ